MLLFIVIHLYFFAGGQIMKKIKEFYSKYKLQFWTILIMSLVGTVMHFVVKLFPTDLGQKIIGPIFPINETIVEHFKMLWYPFLVGGIILAIKKRDIAYFGAFVIAGIFSTILILGLFVFYQSFLTKSVLWLDIILFFVVYFICGMLAFDLTRLPIIKKSWPVWLGLAVIVTATIIVMTYLPGKGYMFQDDSGLEEMFEVMDSLH